MDLVKWEPFREMTGLQASINRLFDEFFSAPGFWGRRGFQGWMFPVDVKETADSVIVKADIPGINKEDVRITYQGNLLTISGERKSETKDERENYLRMERSYGSFSRTIAIDAPVDSDNIKARYHNGILEITLPKTEKGRPREIVIDAD